MSFHKVKVIPYVPTEGYENKMILDQMDRLILIRMPNSRPAKRLALKLAWIKLERAISREIKNLVGFIAFYGKR